jgi:hypothetical protein
MDVAPRGRRCSPSSCRPPTGRRRSPRPRGGAEALGSEARWRRRQRRVGFSAQRLGLSPTLLAAAIGLALGPLAGLRFAFKPPAPEQLMPSAEWPSPALVDGAALEGPVMVSVEYWPQLGVEDNFLAALRDARWSRQRTGASSWRSGAMAPSHVRRVWRDSAEPRRYVEQLVVAWRPGRSIYASTSESASRSGAPRSPNTIRRAKSRGR